MYTIKKHRKYITNTLFEVCKKQYFFYTFLTEQERQKGLFGFFASGRMFIFTSQVRRDGLTKRDHMYIIHYRYIHLGIHGITKMYFIFINREVFFFVLPMLKQLLEQLTPTSTKEKDLYSVFIRLCSVKQSKHLRQIKDIPTYIAKLIGITHQ